MKKIYNWCKAQMQKPETHAAIGAIGGMLIGISQNNYGLGIALAVALGSGTYMVGKKQKGDQQIRVYKTSKI